MIGTESGVSNFKNGHRSFWLRLVSTPVRHQIAFDNCSRPGRARTCNPMIRSYILRLAEAIKRTISAPEWLPAITGVTSGMTTG
jgi:hypothetical protein